MRKLLLIAALVLYASPALAGASGGAGPVYQNTPSSLNMTAYQGGSWSSVGVTGNFWQATQPVSLASVPTHAVTQSGTWSNQITDGTTTANVAPASGSQNGQGGLEGAATNQVVTATFTSATTGTIYDVSSYRFVSIQITANASVNTLTPQCSNDGTFAAASGMFVQPVDGSTNSLGQTTIATSSNRIYQCGLAGKYFRINCSTFVSGTTTVLIMFSTLPPPIMTIGPPAQNGTWTVQPGNTPNTSAWLVTQTASAAGGYSYSHLAANATTTIKSGAGFLHSITVGTQGATDTITVYDNTAGSGTVISVINDGSVSSNSLIFDAAFATGLTVVIAGTTAPDVTFTYK